MGDVVKIKLPMPDPEGLLIVSSFNLFASLFALGTMLQGRVNFFMEDTIIHISRPDTGVFILILNRGGEICSLLHKGHRPGVLRRVRFLKEKPHCWQEAGSRVKPLWCADFSICMRWSRTSFSLIPNNFEISRKSRESPSKASAIFFLKVDI